jgi:hypothetical protein
MASDKQQYRDALVRWDTLNEERMYSLPRYLGGVAVLCSCNDWPLESMEDSPGSRTGDDPAALRAEALKLAAAIRAGGQAVDVALDATGSDIDAVLQDRRISDVIVIGHGNLSDFFIRDMRTDGVYDWLDVSIAADHLKTGLFVQRTCAVPSRSLSVPLGLFAMHDHRNVIAPVGSFFMPTSLSHPDNDLLVQVTDMRRMAYRDVKKRFRVYICDDESDAASPDM